VPWWLGPLVYIPPILHFLGMCAAVHALLTARSAQARIAWFISLITFPYVALPLYLIISPSKFEGYRMIFRAGRLKRTGRYAEKVLTPMREFPPRRDGEDPEILDVYEHLARVPFTGHNRARLLVDGEETYQAMWEAIDAATTYVLVFFFIVNDDGVGRELLAHLVGRAQAGVRVVFVYDEFGCWWITQDYLDDLRAGGVEVHVFSSSNGWRNRLQINFRNHRKIVVVDGRVALTGGLNVGDEQLGRTVKYGPWRDTHLLLEGPAVQGVQLVFEEDYHWASGGRVLDIPWDPQPTAGDVNALYLASGPADVVEVGLLFFLHTINAARKRLWISSPYFVPDESVLEALKLADLRGVDIRILLPRRSDHLFMHLAAMSYLPELEAETHIQIWRYPAYNHQKVILVDDWLSVVGSSNLDNRSMRLNFEGNMVLADRAFASQVEEMLEHDLERSERLTAHALEKRGLMGKLGAQLCRLFDPIL